MREPAPSPDPLRILIVDDDPENRRTLLELLEGWDLQILGEAADGASAVELATRLVPDIVLMDIRMPVMDGLEATKRITEAVPTSRVILLTADDDPSLRRRAEQHGGFGYVPKSSSAASIHDEIMRAGAANARPTVR